MAASRRVAVASFAALGLTLAACDALLGLDQYKDVACAFDCGSSAHDGGGADRGAIDAAEEPDAPDASDAGPDAADASADVVTMPDSGWPVPTGHEIWAHWPMPNPDASVGGDSATALPHPMTYDAGGADGGGAIVHDAVTGLSWQRASQPAADYGAAWGACGKLAPLGTVPWRLPTRIELVSLIDFTQPSGHPTLDPAAFPSVPGQVHWTSSAVPGDDGPAGYWSVDLATGLASSSGAATQALCVNGGAQ